MESTQQVAVYKHEMKTLSELAQQAIFVQHACNIRAMARSFVGVVDDVRAHYPTADWVSHPIIQVWIDKFASLAGTQTEWDSLAAYRQVEQLAGSQL